MKFTTSIDQLVEDEAIYQLSQQYALVTPAKDVWTSS